MEVLCLQQQAAAQALQGADLFCQKYIFQPSRRRRSNQHQANAQMLKIILNKEHM